MARVTTAKVNDERQVVILREISADGTTLSELKLSFEDVRIASAALRRHLIESTPQELPPETTRTEPAPAPTE